MGVQPKQTPNKTHTRKRNTSRTTNANPQQISKKSKHWHALVTTARRIGGRTNRWRHKPSFSPRKRKEGRRRSWASFLNSNRNSTRKRNRTESKLRTTPTPTPKPNLNRTQTETGLPNTNSEPDFWPQSSKNTTEIQFLNRNPKLKSKPQTRNRNRIQTEKKKQNLYPESEPKSKTEIRNQTQNQFETYQII